MITSEISSTEVVSEMLVAAVTAADPVTATCRPSPAQCDRQPAAVVPLRGIRPGRLMWLTIGSVGHLGTPFGFGHAPVA